MSFSGGVFSINTSGQPVVTNTVISSTAFNLLTADLATGLSTCMLKDGTQTITANIPMSSFKFTGLAAGSASGDSVRYEQVNLLAWNPLPARASADQSITSSTVLANATNMSFSIAASEEWVATFYCHIGAALSTTGVKLAITTPASATQDITVGMFPLLDNAAASTNTRFSITTTTSGATLDFVTGELSGATSALAIVSVWVLNSTNAGTVQLQFAQSSSSGTAVTIRKGSHVVANRIA